MLSSSGWSGLDLLALAIGPQLGRGFGAYLLILRSSSSDSVYSKSKFGQEDLIELYVCSLVRILYAAEEGSMFLSSLSAGVLSFFQWMSMSNIVDRLAVVL